MPVRKFDEEKVEDAILEIIDTAGMPVTVEYVARKIGVTWASTRAILFELSIERRLRAVRTTHSWVFVRQQTNVDK